VPAAEPGIADGELDALFAAIASARRVALAVSGGADSLALLDCFDRWRRRGDRPVATVLSVDHRLRETSAAEAAAVAAVAAGRGLACRVLAWEGPRPQSGIEAAARAARYRLMLDAAREEGASHLLVAHHRDDQAETVLMRLLRGSAVFGLAGMRREADAGGIVVLRPFLDLPKSRLAATAAAAGLVPVQDPMNGDTRFLRARLRRAMPRLAAYGLAPAALAAAAGHFAAAADAIDAAVTVAIATGVEFDALAVAWLDAEAFRALPADIRGRLLSRLLQAVGGEPYPPRSARLAALVGAMAAATGRFKRTLAGAVVERRSRRFAIYREQGRRGLPEIAVAGPATLVWDHRFAIAVSGCVPRGLAVGALGESGRRKIKAAATFAPAAAIAAVPAFRVNGALVGVPSLSWCAPGVAAISVAIRALIAERSATPPRFPGLAQAPATGVHPAVISA
jgi:tRNA(Ile)-lysidine synthase